MTLANNPEIPAIGRLSAQLFQTLKSRIADGEYIPGEFLPGQRELAREHDLAQNTVKRALGKLVDAGLLRKMNLEGRAVYEHDYG